MLSIYLKKYIYDVFVLHLFIKVLFSFKKEKNLENKKNLY